MKYLFRAQFNDGTGFSQDPEDKNPNGPGSSFTHLMAEAEIHGGILEFSIDGNDTSASVNLNDGSFTINGINFGAHDQELTPRDLRLVYFRETKQHIIGGMVADSEISRFFIGWQYTEDGVNHQQTIFLS